MITFASRPKTILWIASVLFILRGSLVSDGGELLNESESRHGAGLKSAFAGVVAQAPHVSVEVEVNESATVPGTLIDSDRGICVAKASLLREVVTEEDLFRCRLLEDHWVTARFLGYEKQQDLVYLGYELSENEKLPPVEFETELQVGQWVVSPGFAQEKPAGVGVLGATPREIPSSEGYIGLSVTQDESGLKVNQVYANSGAARAGLKSGDLLLKAESEPWKKRGMLSRFFNQFEPGDWFILNAVREGEPMVFDVRVGASWDKVVNRQAMMNRFGSDVSKRRSGFQSVLQHDTLLSPSLCGGPLINLKGKLIGVNIARAGRTDTLALPIRDVKETAEELWKAAD